MIMFRTSVPALALSLLMVFLVGCAGPQGLDTQSGRPEISVESVHVTADDLTSVILNYYLNKGHTIVTREKSQLVLESPIHETSFSRYKLRLTFNLIQTRNEIRVVTQMKRLELPSFYGKTVENESDVAPASRIGKQVQKDLTNIKDRLIDESSFKGIEGETDSDTSTS